MLNLCVMLLFVASSGLSYANSIDDIDKEIQSLQIELQTTRKQAFNKQMEAQPLMFDNWDEYAEVVQSEENDEQQVTKIKNKIHDLMMRKQVLKTEKK
ncbi:MAG: hypothetical protein WCF65_01845 [Parachlamydiaceae bacterium]